MINWDDEAPIRPPLRAASIVIGAQCTTGLTFLACIALRDKDLIDIYGCPSASRYF